MEKRANFPYLETRRDYLEHALYEAQRQVDAAVYENKPDNAMQARLTDLRCELEELRYVLRVLGPQQNRIEITTAHLVIYLVLTALMFLALRYFGG